MHEQPIPNLSPYSASHFRQLQSEECCISAKALLGKISLNQNADME
jgi:hypothetical protein